MASSSAGRTCRAGLLQRPPRQRTASEGAQGKRMPVSLSFPARPAGGAPAAKHFLVYFIPGNPGFIDYYEPFLHTLRTLLDEVEDRVHGAVCFHLHGRNLLGFDDGDTGGGAYGAPPFDLDTQIRAAADGVGAAAAHIDGPGDARHGTAFDEVVLMGHSVGSYIALEVFRRGAPKDATQGTQGTQGTGRARLRLGILLFATLTHLAQSPRGRRLERLVEAPLLGAYAADAAQAFVRWCLPAWLRSLVVWRVLRFPPHAAAVTLRFLASGGGVRQALFLGRDELRQIGEDQWEDELWEMAAEEEGDDDDDEKPPKFIILFGENDHWVATGFRNRFIARRAAHKRNRARIVVDERGWPHDFCIRHGEEVAELVKTWLGDLATTV